MSAENYILGLSAYYHDAAAALLREGEIVAAAQEERFSRRKSDERFPQAAIAYCLRAGAVQPGELAAVVFYDKPIVKFTRVLESFLAVAPAGGRSFVRFLPSWLEEKLELRGTIRRALPGLADTCAIAFTEHHQAHAASAFYPSPFTEAAILTVDGVGEWATTVIAHGRGDVITPLCELRFPHSLGLLYSAFTAYCGFRINEGEYKLMGLAAYGEPKYVRAIRGALLDLREDGSFRLNLDYFHFLRGSTMTNERFHQLFGGPPRAPEEAITSRHCDLARSMQAVAEEAMLLLAREAQRRTGSSQLCLAGGVALNGVANGRLLREGPFQRLWIQPAAGDAGGALGAALAVWHAGRRAREDAVPARPEAERTKAGDAMQGALLGPEFSDAEIAAVLAQHGAVARWLPREELLDETVRLLAAEKVVGWFQGRMEFGPRALGNRSILADPRSPHMQSVLNLKVKFRESFRPLAPAILRERVEEYFALTTDSPYMLLVAPLRAERQSRPPFGVAGLERIRHPHSTLPAVTHVDFSARIQTVAPETNPLFHALLTRFAAATGCPVLVNTSFNVRGEPIVGHPDDAYRCFRYTQMDALVIGSYLLRQEEQPVHRWPPRGDARPD